MNKPKLSFDVLIEISASQTDFKYEKDLTFESRDKNSFKH